MSVWDSACTHLVMEEVRVTQKVVLALLQQRPIVSLDWLERIATVYQSQTNPSVEPVIPDPSG